MASAANPYSAYKQNSANTATPGQLTLMLYNGCLKFMKKAEKAIDENNLEEKNTNLLKAQAIIRELMVTLKTDSELGKSMLALYDFILRRLVDANVKADKVALKEAEEFVIQFRDSWKEVVAMDRRERHLNGGRI